MFYLKSLPHKCIYLLILIPLCVQCDSNSASCKAEKSSVKVQSNSSNNKVWVSFFNQDTQQDFSVTDVTEDSPKTITFLSPGQYYIRATVYKSGLSPHEMRLSTTLKDCYDYNLSVDAFGGSSMSLSGKPR